MNISEVSKRAKLPASTLRYYEQKGLIRSIGREGLKRVYRDTVLTELALISLGRNVGFSLDEIAEILKTDGPHIDKQQLRDKAMELDEQIALMTAMRDGLVHASECQAPSHMECPTFQRYLNIAGKRWQRPKHREKTPR